MFIRVFVERGIDALKSVKQNIFSFIMNSVTLRFKGGICSIAIYLNALKNCFHLEIMTTTLLFSITRLFNKSN